MHVARKSIKRARALLRLLREEVGRAAYQRENSALRDCARPLSRVRDAVAMRETLKSVGAHSRQNGVIDQVARALARERLQARREMLPVEALEQSMLALAQSERRIGDWRPAASDDQLLASLRRLYRKGRKALVRARCEPSESSLHEARKQVKYLELALEPFQHLKPSRRVSRAMEKTEAIEEDLGRGHDLAVLRAWIEPQLGRSRRGDELVARIDALRAKLDRRALDLGDRFYAKSPARFRKHLLPVIAQHEPGRQVVESTGSPRSSARRHAKSSARKGKSRLWRAPSERPEEDGRSGRPRRRTRCEP